MGVKLIVTGYILGALIVTLGGFLVGFNKQIVHFLVKSVNTILYINRKLIRIKIKKFFASLFIYMF